MVYLLCICKRLKCIQFLLTATCCTATATGMAKWICPVDQRCACPTTVTGRNPFSCYDPSQYSCSTTSPLWPKSGLISQTGVSDAGACGSLRKHLPLLKFHSPHLKPMLHAVATVAVVYGFVLPIAGRCGGRCGSATAISLV